MHRCNLFPQNGNYFQIQDGENYTITKLVSYLPNLENLQIISKYGQKEGFRDTGWPKKTYNGTE